MEWSMKEYLNENKNISQIRFRIYFILNISWN